LRIRRVKTEPRQGCWLRVTGFLTTDLASDWQNKILWVNDRPENNVYERKAMESMGLEFTLVLSTDEAIQMLGVRRFAAIISDIGRKEGPCEGYAFLEAVRAKDSTTLFSIYAGSRARHHHREAALRDAQGATNIAEELANHRLAAVDDGALSPARPDVRPTPETDSVALHFGLLCITAMYHRNVYR
jgi:CheY-like chemotaxis protein